jgi:hypothetical protein
MFSQTRLLARASVEIACRRQLSVPSGLGLFSPRPFSGLAFQGLPALDQPHPECPVAGISRCSSKAAAFIGTPPEFI